jgi:selenide,water dikinase
MGGKPLTALSIIGFPIETLSYKLMNKMLRGGIDKMKEAGVMVIGGHSIKDNEIKFGFAVTGEINPKKIITNDKAKPDDVLVLTKPIGTGIVGFASQIDKASPSTLQTVSRSMVELNRAASDVMIEMGVTTATDITGFGLAGHLSEIVVQSGVTAEIYFDLIPVFDGVLALVKKGVISGGIERNREYASQFVVARDGINEEMQAVFYDPQTSGGLLISLNEDRGEEIISCLKQKGVEQAVIIGKIVSKSKGKIILKRNSEK